MGMNLLKLGTAGEKYSDDVVAVEPAACRRRCTCSMETEDTVVVSQVESED